MGKYLVALSNRRVVEMVAREWLTQTVEEQQQNIASQLNTAFGCFERSAVQFHVDNKEDCLRLLEDTQVCLVGLAATMESMIEQSPLTRSWAGVNLVLISFRIDGLEKIIQSIKDEGLLADNNMMVVWGEKVIKQVLELRRM
jgi:hypothetical protein